MKSTISALTLFFFIVILFPFSGHAQRRDQLTEKEIELVRETQEINLRTEVFIKAIDRRFLVINNDASKAKQAEKDSEIWGDFPKGTRGQLLLDIEKILEEAINNIDDLSERDAKNELLPKAVHTLADASIKFLPLLKSQLEKTNTDTEKGAILGAIDFCNQVIESSVKVPKPEPKTKKKRDNSKD